jgi:hypothetical protein
LRQSGGVFWVEGTGFPNASTVGRNTLFTDGTNNFDLSLLKTFAVIESKRLEVRWEAHRTPSTIRNLCKCRQGTLSTLWQGGF